MPLVKQDRLGGAPKIGDIWNRLHSDGVEEALVYSVFTHKNGRDFSAMILPARTGRPHRIDSLSVPETEYDWHASGFFDFRDDEESTEVGRLSRFSAVIGKVPDGEVAKIAGVHPISVGNYRRIHKIPKFGVTA